MHDSLLIFGSIYGSDISFRKLEANSNRKFVRTDDTTQDVEETATAFTVAVTREQSFSLQIHESKSKERG